MAAVLDTERSNDYWCGESNSGMCIEATAVKKFVVFEEDSSAKQPLSMADLALQMGRPGHRAHLLPRSFCCLPVSINFVYLLVCLPLCVVCSSLAGTLLYVWPNERALPVTVTIRSLHHTLFERVVPSRVLICSIAHRARAPIFSSGRRP
jgi:hypothetical protein